MTPVILQDPQRLEVTFEDPSGLLRVLSAQRVRVLHVLAKERFGLLVEVDTAISH
jgi:hypothetical protein